MPYKDINPFCFAEAVAPHIAAEKNGVRLSAKEIAKSIRHTLDNVNFDYALIEGAGGWRVPINEAETLADVGEAIECAGNFGGGYEARLPQSRTAHRRSYRARWRGFARLDCQ